MNTPPLFVGLMLLFWSWEANLLPLGVIGALILELSRVVRWRWDFSETDMRRAWDLCGVLFFAAAVYGYVTTDITVGPAKFMPWMPMIFFPFVVAATYSAQDRVRFSTYFWLLRRKGRAVAPDRELGWFVPYWYFVVCFIAASIVNVRDFRFYAGVVLFGAWLLWICRSRTAPVWVWMLVLVAVAAVGFGGHIGLTQLQALVENKAGEMFQDLISSDTEVSQKRTAIGSVGKLKLSNHITLRVETDGVHSPPERLRKASFNIYQPSGNSAVWSSTVPGFGEVSPGAEVGTWNLAPRRSTASVATVSIFLLRGTGILPVPNGSSILESLWAAAVQTNRCGSVRVREASPLVRYTVKYGDASTFDAPPDASDLKIPKEEATAVTKIAAELGLTGQPPSEILRRIQTFFQDKFTYCTYLKTTAYDPTSQNTPLSQFLLHDRAGHCEYFGTAATLLLRQAGVPARYAIGFAVPEEGGDRRVHVVRDRHAHAWTLAYVNGAWKDFDTTPASWGEIEKAQKSIFQPLSDFLAGLKYSFARWRYYGERRVAAKLVLWFAAVVVIWIAWRLFGRKHRARRPEQTQPEEKPSYAGLDSEFYLIERHLAKAGVPRRDGESLGEWVSRLESASQAGLTVQPLRGIINLHYAYRFDPQGITDEHRRQLKAGVESWLTRNAATGSSKRRT